MTAGRRRGRPRKAPSPTALDWTEHRALARKVVRNQLRGLREGFRHHDQALRDLEEELESIALLQLEALCRRYIPSAGDPAKYLWRFLPKRCSRPFQEAIAPALARLRERGLPDGTPAPVRLPDPPVSYLDDPWLAAAAKRFVDELIGTPAFLRRLLDWKHRQIVWARTAFRIKEEQKPMSTDAWTRTQAMALAALSEHQQGPQLWDAAVMATQRYRADRQRLLGHWQERARAVGRLRAYAEPLFARLDKATADALRLVLAKFEQAAALDPTLAIDTRDLEEAAEIPEQEAAHK